MKTKIQRNIIFIVVVFTAGIIFSCEENFTDEPFYEGIYEGIDKSIAEFINAKEDTFIRFQKLIEVGELEKTLEAYNPHGNNYTLFLPTNEAFEDFISFNENYSSFQELLDDKDYSKALVRYHVISTALQNNDFPYGALPDTTLSGDLLTVGFSGDVDSVVQKINNYASILRPNIELTNGYIHVIDEVLVPIVFSSYEWLKQYSDYSIFTDALELTGLKDTFQVVDKGNKFYSPNTTIVETNSVFHKSGIYSIDDLKAKYSPDRNDYKEYDNGLFQFVAYHILEGEYFLNNFEGKNSNYNTYADAPVEINATGIDIKINEGVAVFDSIIDQNDTTVIDFIKIKYDSSNVLTKNGAIHFIEDVMEVYTPRSKDRNFQFYEESVINEASQSPNTYIFNDPEEFDIIDWEGVDEISYTKYSTDISGIWNSDYLEIEGDFSISYQVPKILPGRYMFQIRANDDYFDNATIQVFLDGKRVGSNIDLATNVSRSSPHNTYNIGQVNFINYQTHEVTIKTLISGKMTWDAVIFDPIKD